jgi:signal peptidase I
LEQRDGVLFLNGQRLDEPYLERYDRGDVLMEARGGYLMLGDNRQESQDSRVWGPLPDRDFRGRILGP